MKVFHNSPVGTLTDLAALGDRARKNETVFDPFHVMRGVTSDVYNFSGIYFKMFHRHINITVLARTTTLLWRETLLISI